VILARRPDGSRAIAASAQPAPAMTAGEWCGRAVELDGAGGFSV
jgi:hypothetical protein